MLQEPLPALPIGIREWSDLRESLVCQSRAGSLSAASPSHHQTFLFGNRWEKASAAIEDEISNTSTQSLGNQLIWILVFSGARESLDSSPFLSVWYCLKSSLRVTYFFFFFASLHIGFKTYSFSWQTVYFRSVDLCIFLDLSLYSSFSGTSLTPLRELGFWLSAFPPLSCLHFIFISHVNIHHSCALLVNARLQCLLPSTP